MNKDTASCTIPQGISIALWDLLGKATGQPVGRLLGGRYRDRVRPYASLLMQEPEPLTDHLLQLREQGFRAFKIGWGPFGRRDRLLNRRGNRLSEVEIMEALEQTGGHRQRAAELLGVSERTLYRQLQRLRSGD